MNYTENSKNSPKDIRYLEPQDKPREKIRLSGAKGLSDRELVCAILGTGCSGTPVMELADTVVRYLAQSGSNDLEFEKLLEIRGLGPAQTAVLCASLELGRRLQHPVRMRYATSKAVYEHIRHYADRPQEHLICIMFNGAMEIIQTKVVTIGLVNRTLVHAREIFSEPIKVMATSIIIAHNHPSGNISPSEDDITSTQKLVAAGKVVGIKVLDHLVISEEGFHSMQEHGDVWFG